ncbi:hypothetical protein [Niameybacter sp.]|uniref:hypothetical protein n=1 Tax=Niameybacter sp. TaxID=2033640 RepID=UPI002FC8E954
MKKNKFNFLSKLLIIITIIYVVIFIIYQFYGANIGTLNISIASDKEQVEAVQISITPTKDLRQYYLLIYEDNFSDSWLYFISNTYNKDAQHILEEILPPHTDKYVFLEGSSQKNTHTFTIKSKYPINHLTNQDHAFHAYLIVPYEIFPFPIFYYIKHQVFFINIGI